MITLGPIEVPDYKLELDREDQATKAAAQPIADAYEQHIGRETKRHTGQLEDSIRVVQDKRGTRVEPVGDRIEPQRNDRRTNAQVVGALNSTRKIRPYEVKPTTEDKASKAFDRTVKPKVTP